MAALTVAAGSSLGALASRKHTSRRIALTRSTRSPAYKRTCLKTRAGPEDQLGTGMGDDLNYNVLAERMKALQAKESTDTDEVVDAAIEREQAIVAGIRGDAAERPMRESPPPTLPCRSP
jgi:hypothetical protein